MDRERTHYIVTIISLFLTTFLQEGFAPPEDDELEEQHPEDQDEY